MSLKNRKQAKIHAECTSRLNLAWLVAFVSIFLHGFYVLVVFMCFGLAYICFGVMLLCRNRLQGLSLGFGKQSFDEVAINANDDKCG